MKNRKFTTLAIAALSWMNLASSALQGAVTSFDDITYWVGSGSNESALVIDFHDGTGTSSFAWGYRWDGEASGAQMILDIAALDPMLSIVNLGDASSGFYLTEISYGSHSQTADPLGTDGWGYYLAGGTAGGDSSGTDPTSIGDGGTDLPSTWTISPSGASESSSFGGVEYYGRMLADGSWDAWSFGSISESYEHLAPPSGDIVAAPEPSTYAFIVGFLAILGAIVRRRPR
ncbi:MAG: hypothetical protein ACQKBT_01110 [Puniceicoccales bacterium]